MAIPIRLILALLIAALSLPAMAQDQPRGAVPFADSIEDPLTLLRLAERALALRRPTEAAELLERAEARLLTRAELAAEADRPAAGGAISDLAAARGAIARRDEAGAANLIAAARERLEHAEDTPAEGPPKAAPAGLPAPLPVEKPPPLR